MSLALCAKVINFRQKAELVTTKIQLKQLEQFHVQGFYKRYKIK